MTLIDCQGSPEPLRKRVVKNTPFQRWLQAAGLTQKLLAELVGASENTLSRQMRGEWEVPGYVFTAVRAWELMSPDQREALLKSVREDERPSNKLP